MTAKVEFDFANAATAVLPTVTKESTKGELRRLADAALAQFLAQGRTVTVCPTREQQ